MQEFEKEMIQNFDIVINYYKNIDSQKADTYTDFQKEYFEKVKAFEILPESEQERIKNIEKVITSEIVYINEVEK